MDEHDRHVRFTWPDPLLEAGVQWEDPRLWASGDGPTRSVMLQVQGIGAYLRALLPVRLSGGSSVTFGVWAEVAPSDLARAFELWWAPEYADLTISGSLANRVRPWDVLGAPVDLAVRDVDETPYCIGSAAPALAAVIGDEWEHGPVLDVLPH